MGSIAPSLGGSSTRVRNGGAALLSVAASVTFYDRILSVDDALGILTSLERSFREQISRGESMSVENLQGVAAVIASLKEFVGRCKESNRQLRDLIDALERKLHCISSKLLEVTAELGEVKRKLDTVQLRLADFEKRDTPITIRAVMRKLEKALCTEAAASLAHLSVTQRKRLYNFQKFKQDSDPAVPAALATSPFSPRPHRARILHRILEGSRRCSNAQLPPRVIIGGDERAHHGRA